MSNRTVSVLILFAAFCIVAAPAFAQDMAGEAPAPEEEKAAPAAEEETSPEEKEAIERVPTYEEVAEPVPAESPQAIFLRLAEDYIYRSEIGTRSIGSVPVWPRGAFKFGPVKVFPYVEGRLAWTDNAYQDNSEKSSWLFTEGGGVTAELPFMGGSGTVSAGGDYKHFDYLQAGDESYSEWVLGAGVSYAFPRGITLGAGVKWERLVDPIRLEDTGLQRRDHWYPYVDLGMKNAFGNKIDIEVGVDYQNTDYDSRRDETGNRDEWNAHAKVSYPLLRDTTRVYLRYDYTAFSAESERLNDLNGGHELSAGIEGDIPVTKTGKLVGTVGFGYRRNAYGDPHTYRDGSDVLRTDRDSDKGVVTVRAAVRYLASAKTSAELRFLRDLDFSAAGNYQTVNRFDLAVTHTILRQLLTRAGIYFETDDYSARRWDSVSEFGVGIGARYLLIENVDIDLALDWYNRDANVGQFDYNRFFGSLGVTLYFR